jgi:peroxiredoxin (alkyl hydroperoxide reductase subunit C)
MPLRIGDTAPPFSLPAIAGEEPVTIKTSDYLGKKNVVITFHPLDWTPT